MPPPTPNSDLTISTSDNLSIHLTYSPSVVPAVPVVNMSSTSSQQDQKKIRILILNPNSSQSMTEGMKKAISSLNLPDVCFPLSFFRSSFVLLYPIFNIPSSH